MLDFDVRLTKDKKIVVIHDKSVNRTTSGKGLVRNYSLESLKKLDGGFHFSFDGQHFPFRNKGVKIPTLEEVFKEFKNSSFNIHIHIADLYLERQLVSLIGKYKAWDRTIVNSFNDFSVKRLKKLSNKIKTSVGYLSGWGIYLSYKLGFLNRWKKVSDYLEIPTSHLSINLIDKSFVDTCHERKVRVFYWTVNEPDLMRKILKVEADGIITDFPNVLSKIIKENNRAKL